MRLPEMKNTCEGGKMNKINKRIDIFEYVEIQTIQNKQRGAKRILKIEQRISELGKYQVVNVHIIGVTKGTDRKNI